MVKLDENDRMRRENVSALQLVTVNGYYPTQSDAVGTRDEQRKLLTDTGSESCQQNKAVYYGTMLKAKQINNRRQSCDFND